MNHSTVLGSQWEKKRLSLWSGASIGVAIIMEILPHRQCRQGQGSSQHQKNPAAVIGLLKRRSIHNRNIQPELLRAEPRADIFGGADD